MEMVEVGRGRGGGKEGRGEEEEEEREWNRPLGSAQVSRGYRHSQFHPSA